MHTKTHGVKAFRGSERTKDKEFVLQSIRKKIENATGYTIEHLQSHYSQKKLYRIGLKYVSTTNKAICEALNIPVEAGTRFKRKLEKSGRLVTSILPRICPYTGHRAHFLSTNAEQFFC